MATYIPAQNGIIFDSIINVQGTGTIYTAPANRFGIISIVVSISTSGAAAEVTVGGRIVLRTASFTGGHYYSSGYGFISSSSAGILSASTITFIGPSESIVSNNASTFVKGLLFRNIT